MRVVSLRIAYVNTENFLPASILVVVEPVAYPAVAPDLRGPVAHLHGLILSLLIKRYLALFLENLFTSL